MANSIDSLSGAIMERLFVELEASARHVHLTEADALALFGHKLTRKRDLSQPGQYLCEERVTVVGPKGSLSRVAVLGPERPESQVEISLTDARVLGVEVSVRLSGDIRDTPGIRLWGERGEVTLARGLVAAKRHIHMTPQDAERFGVRSGQEVRLRCFTSRPLVLEGVEVRVQTAIAIQAVAEPYIRSKAIRHLEKGRVVIFGCGTGNPFFSTDTAAVLRAAEIDADVILLAKNIDGVYSADPKLDPSAKKYDAISYDDVLAQHLKVMDSTATSLSMDNRIPVLLFALKDPENILRAVMGEAIGTIVG